jgi:hypothetical protein
MTLSQITHYLEAAPFVAVAIGLVGHAFAALPWTWAKTVGNVLNAVSVDFGDLVSSLRNARASVAAKQEEPKS